MTSVRHYTDEELERYAFAPRSFAGKAAVEAHLTGCRDCRKRLAVLEGIEDALRQKIPWLMSDDIRSEPRPVPSTLQALAATIDEERARARAVLEPLLASPLRFRNADLINDATFHTAGAVAVLCQAARDLTERQPQFALLVANAAVAIASNLTASKKLRSPLHLGRAFLERGRTLFVIGRYKDAEDALARAERAYDTSQSGTGWDLASVWLIQANVFVESERPGKARLLAIAAARQFRLFGDVTMYLNAQLLLASILFMEQDYRASAEAAEEIVQQTRARGDTLLLARALQNWRRASNASTTRTASLRRSESPTTLLLHACSLPKRFCG